MSLRVRGLVKRIGGRELLHDADLDIRPGDRIGVVGPNGAGKTTLLKMLAGLEPNDGGQIQKPRDLEVGLLRQEIDPTQSRSVREEAATALAALDALEDELQALEAEMAEHRGEDELCQQLAARYDSASARFRQHGGFERHARVAEVLEGLGFDAEARDRPLSSFSGGWLMRVELAKLLLARPDVLLLDEPTNHLDLPAIAFFEDTLMRLPGAVLVVSHDRTFLRRHAQRVAELDGRGGLTTYEGGYDRYLVERERRREERVARKATQDRQIAEMERFVERFRAKASKARQAQSKQKAIDRIERIEVEPETARRIRLRIPDPPRSGDTALTLEDIHKSYGGAPVYEGVSLRLGRGDRVALAGPNGAGKSTLLRIAAGALPFEKGERTLGHNVRASFFAQHQLEALDPSKSVLEELAAHARTDEIPRLRGHLGSFLFSGDDVEKKVDVLSGGEKARLALAKLLLRPANLLVLDEPTNHLDIQACEVLEEALAGFAGTLLFVSHDRSFINAIATRVVDVEHGTLTEYLGNYDDYLAKRTLAAQRAEGPPVSTSAAAPASEPAPPSPPRTKAERQQERERRKQRERTKRQLAKLEEQIAAEEERKEAVGWRLSDPEIYSDAEQVAALQGEQADLDATISELYAEWERLADELAALEDALD